MVRALLKIAVNLLSYCCERTIVDLHHFPQAIRVIRDERAYRPQLVNANGFVRQSDLKSLASDPWTHTFRLEWDRSGVWRVQFCFFGRQINAAVHFPGPNDEGLANGGSRGTSWLA